MFNRFRLSKRSDGGPGPSRPNTQSFSGSPFVPNGFMSSEDFGPTVTLPPQTITVNIPGQPNPVTIVASASVVTNPIIPTFTNVIPPPSGGSGSSGSSGSSSGSGSSGSSSSISISSVSSGIQSSILPTPTVTSVIIVSSSTSGGAAISTSGSSTRRADLNSGIIVGGVAATLVGLVGLGLLCLFLIRRRRKQRADEERQYAPTAFVPLANPPPRGEKQRPPSVIEPTPQDGTGEPQADVGRQSAAVAPASESSGRAYTAIASSPTVEPAPPYSR